MAIIEIKKLSKSYGKVKALDSVSFNIKKGEIFGLLGPNGAGKSTLINIVAGILTKDSGSVKVFGKEFEKNEESIKQRMNVTSAYSFLSGILTIEQNLKVYGRLYNVKNLNKRIEFLLKQFKIWDIRKKKVHSLSSGQSMRVNVCKGLINNPKILFLDECTVGLDPDIARITRDIIKDFNKKTGATILFTSHIMSEVEELCNRIAFLHKGKILKIDTADNFKKLIGKEIVEIDFINNINKDKIKEILSKIKSNILVLKKKKLKFEIYNDEELHKIIHIFFKKKFKIKDIKILKPTLDEIFIKISRDEL